MVTDSSAIEDIFYASKMVAVHAEGVKVGEAVHYAKKTQRNLYLCHISLREEIEFIRENKEKGIYVEVTPHHLFLTEKDYEKQGAFAKMIPSLKTKDDQDSLWEAIEEGIVDTIGTDHAPHTMQEKYGKEPPAGVPGEETALPLLLDAVNKSLISLKKVVELTSKNPARIFRIKGKGEISPGYDADLTIIDMNLEKKVNNEELNTKCKWSPFNGYTLRGWPVTTIVGGRIVYNHGKIYKNQGREVIFRG
ncbi:MAG: amidohydrolase family protein [Candidatus Woesearchaeota archaeon]|nr:amidohydrolase family protein [Candidatus Woesearchaeota archaeon]